MPEPLFQIVRFLNFKGNKYWWWQWDKGEEDNDDDIDKYEEDDVNDDDSENDQPSRVHSRKESSGGAGALRPERLWAEVLSSFLLIYSLLFMAIQIMRMFIWLQDDHDDYEENSNINVKCHLQQRVTNNGAKKRFSFSHLERSSS